ncbi:ankyrin repeat-containing domain protein [Cladochytrium replicatum]|nr:ankyrin repeat-containing domain protein [Cladochytrium replicatum]
MSLPADVSSIWLYAGPDYDLNALNELLSRGVDPNIQDPNGYTPLHAASSYGQLDSIRLLVVQYGANVNITDHDGDTPLHFAEAPEVAELLISLGANPTVRNSEGLLPIEKADEDEHDTLVQYLSQFTPEYRPAERHHETPNVDLSYLLQTPDFQEYLRANGANGFGN